MAGCDCCVCEIVANYRGHRTPFDSTTFVAWTNQSHEFHEYEREDSSTTWTADQDSYGPEVMESDGNWVFQSFEFSPPYRTFVRGGEITLRSLWGSWHTITTSRSALIDDASATLSALGETAELRVAANERTEGELEPEGQLSYGNNFSGFAPFYYSTLEQIETARESPLLVTNLMYDDRSIRLLQTSEWSFDPAAIGGTQIELGVWVDIDSSDAGEFLAFVTACAEAAVKAEHRTFPNFYVSERYQPGSINRAGQVQDGIPSFYFPDVEHPTDQLWFARKPYSKDPLHVRGEKVTLYRDGEVVMEAIRPTNAQGLEATAVDGSYLIVSEVNESTDRPWTGTGIDTRRRWPRPYTQLASFVVDRVGPVLGSTAPQDFFVNEWALSQQQVFVLFSTKLVRIGTLSNVEITLSSDGGNVVRPMLLQQLGSSASGGWSTSAGTTVFMPSSVGTYAVFPVVQPSETYSQNAPAGQVRPLTVFRDYPGNAPSFTPTFTVQVHAVPQYNRRGARPKLEDVGLQTREHWRPRLEHEPVRTVRLTFDRKIDPDTVDASQFTLTKNGVPVEGCELQQLSEREWLVTVPEAEQTSSAFFVLTYDPAGDVLTDDVTTEEYPTLQDFPAGSASKYKVVYVDRETKERYSKSPTGYVEITDGRPLDQDGIPYDPEPSVLATRTSWLMASFDGWPEPENVASRNVLIGTRPSIGRQASAPLDDDGSVTISTTQGFEIGDWGSHARTVVADGFTPCVPPDELAEQGPDDYGYWGLRTTIHPCLPRTVTACACAKSNQRHASAIRSIDEIPALTVSVVKRNSTTGAEEAESVTNEHPTTLLRWGAVEFSGELTGDALPQNMWSAELPALPETTKTNAFGTERVTILGGTALVQAFRWVTEYESRQTAYLNELEIEVRFRYTAKRAFEPFPGQGEAPDDEYNVGAEFDRFALSREQEDRLAAGEAVYVSFALGLENGWWKIQRA